VPENRDVPMREVGIASWYGAPFHGRKASNGERYDMNAMTAAHPTMPLPSYARVKNLANGREVVVRVIDRGPFHKGRVIDLSRAAARKLRLNGLGMVEVERLTHDDIRTGAWRERRDAEREAAQARSRGGEAIAAQ
jgi:rare lipoprotein A